jgi:hypothetical protein
VGRGFIFARGGQFMIFERPGAPTANPDEIALPQRYVMAAVERKFLTGLCCNAYSA